MIISESSVDIKSSKVYKNAAVIIGGVIVTYKDLLTSSASTFTNNSVTGDGGVVCSSESSFNIASSMFTNNSATNIGGVMRIYSGSIAIIANTMFIY